MTNTPTQLLSDAGVSIWLDDLSRGRLRTGSLRELIEQKTVTGVTTNPSIFHAAITSGTDYDDAISQKAAAGASVEDTLFEITTEDVANACDVFRAIYESTNGADGRVSIEVEPDLANDTHGTIARAKALFEAVDRPNVLIKIPATRAGLTAITETIAAGISVNVTLIFSLSRYTEVIDAYLAGLERARQAGIDLTTIHSVASFFISRFDLEIDKRLEAMGTAEAAALKGKSGIANAQLAYEVYENAFRTDRAAELLSAGANRQRPLWASTGVKDPGLLDTTYVVELVAPAVVNTMPEKTLDAVFDHGVVAGDTITGSYNTARELLNAIADQGISYDEVAELLERQGVEKFVASWDELLHAVGKALEVRTPSASV
ncbi:transaldolase [Cryobacterium sp. TMT2-15-1]|uniref:transaldolase n=1 Tax=Cryobacterium sp. TMT2-15-1 TaxID=1259246 RepID=UPI00106C7EFC|nr:transaldolase [Cryobacterium sp. TMT2-15-1]TFC56870.1 transaldolase [Cryobacterium sp. TMT2-15-1]